jgi:predicted aspartyl protease
MGKIWAYVTITNLMDTEKVVRCDALVDTGASHMILPSAWRERLGKIRQVRTAQIRTATQEAVEGAINGPVEIQIEGFPPVITEVVFVDMKPDEKGLYTPLIGYIVLEQSEAAVDMLGHGLLRVGYLDAR